MSAYYNEIEPYAAQWLRNLIAAGHIAPGDVDERSIVDVRADDLRGYTQCHFFAGIGVWSYSLRLAGWPDDRPVWTGSCPCQPFSAAGKGAGFDDERHLWPHWFALACALRPSVVFGEQVTSAIGHGWLDLVQSDLEGEGYAVGAVGFPACSVGAPHIRQRLYFVAESGGARVRDRGPGENAGSPRRREGEGDQRQRVRNDVRPDGGSDGPVADAGLPERRPLNAGRHDDDRQASGRGEGAGGPAQRGAVGDMADPIIDDGRGPGRQRAHALGSATEAGADGFMANTNEGGGSRDWAGRIDGGGGEGEDRESAGHDEPATLAHPSATNGFWRNGEWIACRDGKARAVEPGTFPLAHGAPARVGRLRAYGNSIVAPQASEFIRAYMMVPTASARGGRVSTTSIVSTCCAWSTNCSRWPSAASG